MNIETELAKEHTREQGEKIARWIGSNPERFRQLMQLFLESEFRTTQRASWVVSICADQNPGLIKPYLKRMLEKTQEPGVHDAVKRNVVRILQEVEIPRSLRGLAAEICFTFLADKKTAVAIRVFSMTVLYHIAQQEPDFKNELRLLIEENLHQEKTAFKNRGGKILKALAK